MRFCLILLFAIHYSLVVRADIMFNVTYDDVTNNTNIGFDDPMFGATRRTTFSTVLNYVDSVVDHGGTVDFRVKESETDGSGSLASASANFSGTAGYSNGFLFTHATTGSDPGLFMPDAEATFDFGYSWNSGLSSPSSSQFDLFSVVLHEFTHAMGFASIVDADGTGLGGFNPDTFTVFDSHLERGDGTALFGPGGEYLGDAADLISEDVYFDGPNATAANFGSPIPVYSPNPFDTGSSIGHITLPDAVMQFSIAPGTERRSYTAVELGILRDIGWNVSVAAVPEPSSLALLGIAGLVCVARRRRLRSAIA